MRDGTPPLDRAALLGAFDAHGVRFILVGGLAAQAHGAARATQDADICPEWTIDNLFRLASALTDLGARLKIGEGSVETLALDIDARTIHGLKIGAWRTSAGDVDVLLGIPGTSRSELARYEQLARNAIVLQIDATPGINRSGLRSATRLCASGALRSAARSPPCRWQLRAPWVRSRYTLDACFRGQALARFPPAQIRTPPQEHSSAILTPASKRS